MSDGVSVSMDTVAFEAGINRALKEWTSGMAKEDLLVIAEKIKDGAAQRSPVGKTGNLKEGWQVEPGIDTDGAYLEVHNKVGYAVYVEKGHTAKNGTRVPPQPMIIPALTEVLGITGIDHQIQVNRTGGEA